MGKRGTRPMPTVLRVTTGNKSKIHLPDAEPVVDLTLPAKPEGLPDEASKEWDRIVPIMDKMGVISTDSGPAIAGYCMNHVRWSAAAKDIEERGIVLEDDESGRRYANPAVAIENKAITLILRFLVEFGMTPSARSGIRSNKPVKAENDLDAFVLKKKLTG